MSIVAITIFGADGVPRRHLDLAPEDVARNIGSDEAAVRGHHDLGRARLRGSEVVVLPLEPPSPEALLEEARAAALVAVNRAIADARLAHMTALPMQEAIYRMKAKEAERWFTSSDAAPFIAARAKSAGRSQAEVAQEYLEKALAWERLAVTTETVRDAYAMAIVAAQTPGEVEVARDAALGRLKD